MAVSNKQARRAVQSPAENDSPRARPPASVEELRAREENVVHVEEMKATVGEILEHAHGDEAAEVLELQERLPAGAPRAAPAEPAAPTSSTSSAGEATTERPHVARDEAPPQGGTGPRGWRFLSPFFLLAATRDAAAELRAGAQRAVADLRDAVSRARACFSAENSA
jgi:hypothetical protein